MSKRADEVLPLEGIRYNALRGEAWGKIKGFMGAGHIPIISTGAERTKLDK